MLGLYGKKIGMTQVFDENGNVIPVTVVSFQPNIVVSKKTDEKDGYSAAVLGYGSIKEKNITKPIRGQFPEGMKISRDLSEIRNIDIDCNVGDNLDVGIFENIEYVDVQSVSKGKGYQGVMKRHGFRGGRKTHGSKFHRAPGSTGQASYPSKVFKGTRMPGRMGGEKVTVQNLKLIKIDKENQYLIIKGAIPGAKNSNVFVRKAIKK